MSTEILLTSEQLHEVSDLLGISTNPLSPLGSPSGRRTPVHSANPVLVDPQGSLREDLKPIFNLLARPTSVVRVSFLGPRIAFDFSYYTSWNDPDSIVVSNEGESLRLQRPAPVEELLFVVGEQLGGSSTFPPRVDLELSIYDAWAFFTLLDGIRHKMLSAILANEELGDGVTISQGEVIAASEAAFSNLRWLAPYFTEVLPLARPTLDDLRAGLETLIGRGMIAVENGSYRVGRAVDAVAASLLIPAGHLYIKASNLDERGDVGTLEWRALLGSDRMVLLWYEIGGGVQLLTTSPMHVMVILEEFLSEAGASQPSTLKEDGDVVRTSLPLEYLTEP